MRIGHQRQRMGIYTVIALLLGAASFNHELGYWPHGALPSQTSSLTVRVDKKDALPRPIGANQVVDLLGKIIPGIFFVAVGVLFYFSRRPSVTSPSIPLDLHNTTDLEVKRLIDSLENRNTQLRAELATIKLKLGITQGG